MKVGDFGFFEFTIRKKVKGYAEYITPMSGCYEIKELEKNNVLLGDGDKELIVTLHRITKFEVRKKP